LGIHSFVDEDDFLELLDEAGASDSATGVKSTTCSEWEDFVRGTDATTTGSAERPCFVRLRLDAVFVERSEVFDVSG
jgi:hypothetical protein